MNKSKKYIFGSSAFQIIFIVGLILISVSHLFAGPPPPPTGPGCWPPSSCIPIDGGISLLIAAGLLFGGKKVLDLRKNRK